MASHRESNVWLLTGPPGINQEFGEAPTYKTLHQFTRQLDKKRRADLRQNHGNDITYLMWNGPLDAGND